MRSVLIAAGGTGGHFYPGLVLALALRERGWRVLVAIRREDPARARLEAEGLASLELPLGGLPRRPGLAWGGWAAGLWRSLRLADRAVEDLRPSVVVGMGGYLSFPCVLAAARRGLPRAVHESNAVLGLANRASLALGASLFRGLPPLSGPPGTLVGTPVRDSLREAGQAKAARRALGLDEDRPTLLVFGGSQGARALNRIVPAGLRSAPEGRLQVLHLTGPKDLEETRAAYSGSPAAARTAAYLEDMAQAYAAADLVLCRAGASTLAELCALKKPALLVPYPWAAARHQEANARVLERAGAARLLPEEALEAGLAPALSDLIFSDRAQERRREMASAYARLGLPPPRESAGRLADAVEGLARGHET